MWNPFKRHERELDKELRFHIDQQARQYMADGLSETEARRRAAIDFGGAEQIKEDCRELRSTWRLETIARYVRYGGRVLLRNKGFTAVAVLSLALGIGANTAVFQLIDAVLLQKLPVSRPDELVEFHIDGGRQGFGNGRINGELTYPLWEQIRQHPEPFTGVFAWAPGNWNVGEGDNVQTLPGAWFSGEAFSVLGIVPERGRLLNPADDVPDCAHNVVISHRYWQQRFNGANDVAGSQLTVFGLPATVIGVAPPEFFGVEVGSRFDLAFPFCVYGNLVPTRLAARNEFWLRVFGRLEPETTVAKASALLRVSSRSWFEAVAPDNYTPTLMDLWDSFRMTVTPRPNGVSRLRDTYTRSLWLLLGITTLVLVLACANLANLTLARTLARKPEVATRLAIGASRSQVVAQLFTESLILTIAGTAAGAILAGVLSRALVRFLNAHEIVTELNIGMNWTIFAVLTLSALTGCLFFGLSTAFYATRDRSIAGSIAAARTATGSRQWISFQGILVAGQVGISVVLVVSALLFLESFRYLTTLDAGFSQEGLVYTYFNRPIDQSGGTRRLAAEALAAVRNRPGIVSAATSTHRPLNGGRTTLGVPDPTGAPDHFPYFNWVSPGYFETMEIPLLQGRDFETRDSANASRVMIVNQQFARTFLREPNPIGQTVRSLEEPGFPETVYRIVGLVANTRYADLREGNAPIAYMPDAQNPATQILPAVVTRSGMPAAAVGRAVEEALSSVYPGVRVTGTIDLREEVLMGLSRERLLAWLGGFFGLLALSLAAVGIYGVVSYMISTRRREIGIRMTLGASRQRVISMVLLQTTRMTLVGCIFGVALVLGILRLVRGLLFGVAPTDPVVIVVGVAVLLTVALAAAYVPGRDAARTNPVDTLRNE
jgi:predicted permease